MAEPTAPGILVNADSVQISGTSALLAMKNGAVCSPAARSAMDTNATLSIGLPTQITMSRGACCFDGWVRPRLRLHLLGRLRACPTALRCPVYVSCNLQSDGQTLLLVGSSLAAESGSHGTPTAGAGTVTGKTAAVLQHLTATGFPPGRNPVACAATPARRPCPGYTCLPGAKPHKKMGHVFVCKHTWTEEDVLPTHTLAALHVSMPQVVHTLPHTIFQTCSAGVLLCQIQPACHTSFSFLLLPPVTTWRAAIKKRCTAHPCIVASSQARQIPSLLNNTACFNASAVCIRPFHVCVCVCVCVCVWMMVACVGWWHGMAR